MTQTAFSGWSFWRPAWLLYWLTLPRAVRDRKTSAFSSIEPGWRRTRVNAGVYRHHSYSSTFKGRQFVSFYDPKVGVTIAYRESAIGEVGCSSSRTGKATCGRP